MDVASSVIAFAQAAEACVKLARTLIRTYKTYKDANRQVEDLVIRIEAIWIKTEVQVQKLVDIKESLGDRLRTFQVECLLRLQERLVVASLEAQNLVGAEYSSLLLDNLSLVLKPHKKARHALLGKHLQKTVKDLESWHATFDPSWFLIGLITQEKIDSSLKEPSADGVTVAELDAVTSIRQAITDARSERRDGPSIFRNPEFLSNTRVNIPNSSLILSKRHGGGADVVIDRTTFDESVDKHHCAVHVEDLARLLSFSDPTTLGLLECLGATKIFKADQTLSQFEFIFKIPPYLSSPQALRTLLSSSSPSLDAKYRLAKSLARSVMAVHTADFVHKSIRPETIVVFEDSTNTLPTLFLTGFERFRASTGATSLAGDMLWQRNIYRHPFRQGIKPEHIYLMQHDIYSLGVCLLEIGIWTSFVTLSDPPTPGAKLDVSRQLAMKETLTAAKEIKAVLTHMAHDLLPASMGVTYTEIVLSCLTCLDPDVTNMFGGLKDLYDDSGILVGVTFIEKVLMKFESVNL